MSVAFPSGRWNLTANPRPAIGSASFARGWPLAFEKRIVVSTGSPCRCAARESLFASGVAVKVPSHTVPLAWTARKPGWGPPLTALSASTISSHMVAVATVWTLPLGENRPMAQATLLYDRDCGFCRWLLGKVLAWDRRGVLR